MKGLFVIFLMLPFITAEENKIILLDLAPEEANKYIEGTSSDLRYANKIGEGPLPEGKDNYHLGRVIDNPKDFIEQTYLANQFHGQNGLGKAKFGYTDWNQARVEDINVHGKTQGAYKYALPNGQEYEVKYWADSQGFHQTDNRPQIELKPVTDTPAVRAAKEAFEKAWHDAAAANLVPVTDTPAVRAARLAHQQYLQAAGSNLIETSDNNGQYDDGQYDWRKYQEDGVTGPPRGFYYNFDYPVKLIVEKSAVKR